MSLEEKADKPKDRLEVTVTADKGIIISETLSAINEVDFPVITGIKNVYKKLNLKEFLDKYEILRINTRCINNGITTREDSYYLTGTGASAVVFCTGDLKEAWKFSDNATYLLHEYFCLESIKTANKGNLTNVIEVLGTLQEGETGDLGFPEVLCIRYINGDSLEDILKHNLKQLGSYSPTKILKYGIGIAFSPEKVIKYGAGIMNGLIEMRRAKIWYHRDIRPANIMIDEERDEPVIVDFGIATEDRQALPKNNKRFGGPNDLTSLGQVMYYMATGMHLFDQSQSMSRTFGSVADEINDYRTKVYSDPTGKLLEQHLGQVDSEIKDERVATLIKSCLTARRGQYKRMQRMFRRYEE